MAGNITCDKIERGQSVKQDIDLFEEFPELAHNLDGNSDEAVITAAVEYLIDSK